MSLPKKILFIVFTILCIDSFAQHIRYGAIMGVTVATSKELDPHVGFNIGAKGEVELSKNKTGTYLDFGLILSSKGWNCDVYTDAAVTNKTTWNCTLYYLEMPVHIGYKFEISNNVLFFAKAGPYLAVGLFGNTTLKGVDSSIYDKDVISDNVFRNEQYKRFDCGLGAAIGIERKEHLQFIVGYDHGLIKPTKTWSLLKAQNRAFYVSCAYLF